MKQVQKKIIKNYIMKNPLQKRKKKENDDSPCENQEE